MVKRDIEFLLMGVPRSGTTALAYAINLHPDLLCGVEMVNDDQPHRNLDFPRALLESDTLAVERRQHLSHLVKTKPRPLLIGNKLPRYYFSLSSLMPQIPSARVIWLYRSPQQFCSSWNNRAENREDMEWHRGQSGLFGIFELLICIDAILSCKADVLVVPFDSVFVHHQSAFSEVLSFLGVTASAPILDTFHQSYFKAPHILEKRYALTASEREILSAIKIQRLDDLLLRRPPQSINMLRDDLARYLSSVKPLAIAAFRQLEPEFSEEQRTYFLGEWQSIPAVRNFLQFDRISTTGRLFEAPKEIVGRVTGDEPRLANPMVLPDRSESAVTIQISFVIPLFNHLAQTQAMLASLQVTLPAGLAHEIILIDDFSTDGTRAWLATLSDPHIKTLLNPRNLGYAKSNNRAASLATGEVLALLNNDLLFEPGWLEPMLHALQSPTLNAGLVGNVQYRVADGSLDHAGVLLNPNAQFGHIQILAEDAPPHTKALAVTGACMMLRKADFDAQGGFDGQFVNGCEDIDLCFKLRAAGKAIYVANNSRIRHHVSLSRDVNTLHNERNSRHLFGRWRKLIKQEMAAQWATLLQAGPPAYTGLLSGHLAPTFAGTPQAAARVIAESMLLREEYRWARELGEPDANAGVADRCTAHGLVYMPSLNGYTMAQYAEFAFTGLCSARNFYVCGRTTIDLAQQPIAITISVNGIQVQTVTLTTGRSVNVGIVNPILLQGLTNHFRVAAHFVDAQGQHLGDANAAIVVTHIVVDEQVVSDL